MEVNSFLASEKEGTVQEAILSFLICKNFIWILPFERKKSVFFPLLEETCSHRKMTVLQKNGELTWWIWIYLEMVHLIILYLWADSDFVIRVIIINIDDQKMYIQK